MKTVPEITTYVRGCGVTAAAIVLATFTAIVPANAQYKATGDDGVTASPRLRQQLEARRAQPAPSAAVPAMVCPKCTDTWVSRVDPASKGLGGRTLVGKPADLIAKHLCEGCATAWSVSGSGKGKQAVASHKCSGCGSENLACCSSKGTNEVVTKGMGQKFEIAPLK